MRSLTPAAIALFALLAACDDPKPRPPPSDEGAPAFLKAPKAASQAAPEAIPPATPTTEAPPPAPPAWARTLIGKTLAESFPAPDAPCLGNTDLVNLRYAGAVRVEGWGWDQTAKAPVARVLLADAAGRIVGAGETGIGRPDVVAARKEVTSPATGWQGVAAVATGPVSAYGLVGAGKALCRLGQVAAG